MTNQNITLTLNSRSAVGKRLRPLRMQGIVPAVIHDHGNASHHVEAEYGAVFKTYHQAGKHHPVALNVDGKKHLALIKDIDFGPVKHDIRHVVFQAIKQNEAVEAEVPVVFAEGVEIPAEKVSLMVLQQLDTVNIKALPKNLPDQFVVDPSSLAEVGDTLTVADLVVPDGVELLADPEVIIATVEMPKDQIAEANAAAEALAEDAGTAVEVPTADDSEQDDAESKSA